MSLSSAFIVLFSGGPAGLRSSAQATPLSVVHARIVTGKEHGPGGTIDRRALLQRARRSPIRPRSSSVEASARTVSPARLAERDFVMCGRICMGALIQERPRGGKTGAKSTRPQAGFGRHECPSVGVETAWCHVDYRRVFRLQRHATGYARSIERNGIRTIVGEAELAGSRCSARPSSMPCWPFAGACRMVPQARSQTDRKKPKLELVSSGMTEWWTPVHVGRAERPAQYCVQPLGNADIAMRVDRRSIQHRLEQDDDPRIDAQHARRSPPCRAPKG